MEKTILAVGIIALLGATLYLIHEDSKPEQ
jgi:hypothetical protein